MTKQEAYRRQAESDFSVFRLLAARPRNEIPECHPLHYLQMATEKLAKAAFIALNVQFETYSHVAFSEIRHHLKRRDFAERLGFRNRAAYRGFLNKTAGLCRDIDELNPGVGAQRPGGGAKEGPNSEYPWLARDANLREMWNVPAEYSFGLLARLQEEAMGIELVEFIRKLLQRFDGVFR